MAKPATNILANAERTDAGVMVNGFVMEPINEKCEGCERVKLFEDAQYCSSYAQPEAKWHLGACNFATHIKAELDKGKVKINPLKASKRAARGR